MPLQFEPNPLLMQEIPRTLEEFMVCVDKLFHCMNGPPSAYFDIPLVDNRGREPDKTVTYDYDNAHVERLVYATLAWRSLTPRSESIEANLVGRMLEPFIAARKEIDEYGGTPLLLWRRPPEILEDEKPPACKIRCRVAVPGFNFTRYQVLDGELIPLL